MCVLAWAFLLRLSGVLPVVHVGNGSSIVGITMCVGGHRWGSVLGHDASARSHLACQPPGVHVGAGVRTLRASLLGCTLVLVSPTSRNRRCGWV